MLATKLETLQNLIYETLESCKSKYYENISKKLCSKAIAPKYYWSLLKTMLNDKKVPCIPPIFHDNKFVTDFSKKADLFNSSFAKQCSVIENNSVLPSSVVKRYEAIRAISKCVYLFSRKDLTRTKRLTRKH